MKKWIQIFATVLCMAAIINILGGCRSAEEFDSFLTESFITLISQDTLTLHSYLAHPETYGIDKNSIISLPDLSEENRKVSLEREKQLLKALHQFHKKDLSSRQQFDYDILEDYLKLSLENDKKYPYFKTYLGINGLPTSLAVQLSQYYFTDKADIEIYLALLKLVPEHLDSMLAYEIRREDKGMPSSALLLQDTVDEIEQLLANPLEDQLFTTSFAERIAGLSFLTEEEKAAYLLENEQLVADLVLPAYESLRNSLPASLHPSVSQDRLAQYRKGDKYYALLLKKKVGTDLTVKESEEMIHTLLRSVTDESSAIFKENPHLKEDYLSTLPEMTDPSAILDSLKDRCSEDFPALSKDSNYLLCDMPATLASTSSIAYYTLPPIDDATTHTIYFNRLRINTIDVLSTLAHEGYPGHLYQNSYFYQQMSHPIRAFLRNEGFDEGWGTYAQLYSYDYLAFHKKDSADTANLQKLYRDNDVFSVCLCALSDIYVNEKDYTLEDLTNWLADYGISAENAQRIYHNAIEEPAAYLSYAIGYYELMTLKEDAKLQDSYTEADFHESILRLGSAPFYILKKYIFLM